MKFYHPLMHQNFSRSDTRAVVKLLKERDLVLTQSKNVENFEKKWSKWLGVKYSVFVNSGSSANLLTISILKILFKKRREIILPTLTWVSDINSVIQNGFKPVFVDINPKNLCMNENQILEKINKNTLAVFLTHVQGFNGLTRNLINILKRKKIHLLEDVCESYGATFNNKKLGTFGKISNFSFYYAHHMSTIEGGMLCTNDKKIYEMARMLRSHGMVRESNNVNFERRMIRKNPKLSPKFIFLYPAYNFRNTEVGAVIGLNQLRSLNKNNKKRQRNFQLFLKLIDKNKFKIDFDVKGSCNYAFPLIFQRPDFKFRKIFESKLKKCGIEFRRGNAGGGNQLRQPYLKPYLKNISLSKFKEVDHVHFFGYYIGNYPSLSFERIRKLTKILNSI